jgi:Fic family protein
VERPSTCVSHDVTDAVKKEEDATISVNKADALYQVVLPLLLNTLTEPLSSKDLASLFDVSEAQIRKWLNRGVEDGKVKKITKPVRYCRNEADSHSPK